MKKTLRILTLLLVAATLLCTAACSQRDPNVPEGFLLAENDQSDFYFYYPATWLLDRNDGGMTSAYVSEQDFSNVSVTAFTAGNYATLVQYAEEYYFPQFTDNFQNLVVDRNPDGSLKREDMKIDGADALAVKFSARFGGEDYSFRAWFVSFNGYIYTVLYTAKTALYEVNLEAASAIATNLQFR